MPDRRSQPQTWTTATARPLHGPLPSCVEPRSDYSLLALLHRNRRHGRARAARECQPWCQPMCQPRRGRLPPRLLAKLLGSPLPRRRATHTHITGESIHIPSAECRLKESMGDNVSYSTQRLNKLSSIASGVCAQSLASSLVRHSFLA